MDPPFVNGRVRSPEVRRSGVGALRRWVGLGDGWEDSGVAAATMRAAYGARTAHGVFTRVAQRLVALAAAVWRNWTINAPDKRSLIAYDH